MTNSIDFIRPVESALSALKTSCKQIGLIFTQEQEVNKGAGIKLYGTVENQPISIILYYNRNKGTSSKIVLEKVPEELKALLLNELSPNKRPHVKAIPIHASIKVADKNLRQEIKDSLIAAYPNMTECSKQKHMDYLIKIVFGGDELTVTQFSSGTLFLQGGYSDLVDRVVEIVDKAKPLSTEERALLYIPEGDKKIVSKEIKEGIYVSKNAHAIPEADSDDYCTFLSENDRKTLATGVLLTEILERQAKLLPEYNFLVAIYAKVFEGFIISLMLDKNFFTFEQYIANPNCPDIGNALRNKKFEKYIKDTRRNGYVIEKLISVWEGCRCKEMHSDLAAEPGIISVSSLEDAKDKIGEIRSCIKDAYNILVRHGYTDNNLPQKEIQKKNGVSEVMLDVYHLKQNGYIGTDESGKGDYFGPLVVAGVFLDAVAEKRLADAGIRDSKKISDQRIHEFADMIRAYLDKTHYSVVVIGPEKYNELYAKIGNLNKLLAWGHARSIENIIMTVECDSAIADQFGDESYIKKALLEKGKGIKLLQMPKAEQHIAVAAASVLAREAFLLRLAELNKKFNINLPKGASAEVEAAAKHFIQKYGMSQLGRCAKLHFRTTEKLRHSP